LYDPEEIARKLHKHLLSNIEIIGETDLNTIQQSYNSRLFRKDQLVELRKGNEVFQCTIKEVDASGQLIVYDGTKRVIQHGEVEWLI
jgi:biotin-(acetyl-CoA carboxylase) ligase